MILEFSIVPMGKGVHLSEAVARIAQLVDQSGLDYQLTAMGTIVEGKWDDVMDLIRRCHELMKQDHERVLTTIHIDDKGDRKGLIRAKVEAVRKRVDKELRT